MKELTNEDILELRDKFDSNYDNKSPLNSIQAKCTNIIDFMGLENAKKLSLEQVQNMIMVAR